MKCFSFQSYSIELSTFLHVRVLFRNLLRQKGRCSPTASCVPGACVKSILVRVVGSYGHIPGQSDDCPCVWPPYIACVSDSSFTTDAAKLRWYSPEEIIMMHRDRPNKGGRVHLLVTVSVNGKLRRCSKERWHGKDLSLPQRTSCWRSTFGGRGILQASLHEERHVLHVHRF